LNECYIAKIESLDIGIETSQWQFFLSRTK